MLVETKKTNMDTTDFLLYKLRLAMLRLERLRRERRIRAIYRREMERRRALYKLS
jgi:hypothetical protein